MGVVLDVPVLDVPVLEVDVWSDVVCPWCYIGKRRFERAVEQLRGEIDVRVTYRPFQLDPRAPRVGTPVAEAYERKFGSAERAHQIIDHVTRVAAEEGVEFHMERALRANTFDAHRLLWLSEATGRQEALKQRLLEAYFEQGLDVGDRDVLADCAAEVGLDRNGVRRFLDSDDGAEQVLATLNAAVAAEITAVPTYVITAGAARWAIPGAQDTDTFVQVMRRVAARAEAAQAAE
jgi:predicted DsbA family dithiol-disulfide isomerase